MCKLIKYICILLIMGLFANETLATNSSSEFNFFVVENLNFFEQKSYKKYLILKVILAQDKDIKVMSTDLTTNILTLSGHTDNVFSLKILPDGRLASGSLDNTVGIWNLNTGYSDFILYGHTGPIYSLEVLANGYLVSVGGDYAIRIWNTTTGTLLQSITDVHLDNINIVKTINQNYFATGSSDTLVKVLQ